MPCSFICSSSESLPKIPPKIRGWSVFRRPPIISGKLVTSSTGRTEIPESEITFEVPPVEIISMPLSDKPLDNSSIPDLSLTLISTLDIGRRYKLSFSSTLNFRYCPEAVSDVLQIILLKDKP